MNQKNKEPVALVTGATGTIGPLLVSGLLEQGYRVNILLRDSSSVGDLPMDRVQVFRGEINNLTALQEATSGVDYVFHLAALLHINNPDSSMLKEYERINVEGTRLLVKAAQEARVKRMIFFSTINVYGPGQPGLVFDEETSINPSDWYAKSKAEAEKIVLDGLPAVVLRLAAVYGSKMKGNYRKMLEAMRKGLFVSIGKGENRRTIIFEDDVVAATLLAAVHPHASGKTYNVSDGQIYKLSQIIDAICEALDRRSPVLRLPLPLVKFLVGLVEDTIRFTGKDPKINRTLVEKYTEDMAVSAQKIQNELGFIPTFDLKSGWRETVRRIYGS